MSSWWFNNSNNTRLIEIDNNNFVPFMKSTIRCERCGNFVHKSSTCWISKCDRCGAYISFFMPTPIQQAAALAESKVLFNIGAVGSGKTTISSYIFSNRLRLIANSRMICLAQTKQQLEKNAVSELKKFFHPSEIKNMTQDSWTLNNGSVIEFWPSDDPDKLRSANANFIWIVEANNEKMRRMFEQAITRIRNEKGFVYKKDINGNIQYKKWANGKITPIILQNRNMIIVEANPEKGAWTNRAVLGVHTLLYTSSVRGMEVLKNQAKPKRAFDEFEQQETNSDYLGILNATADNPTLPKDYLTDIRGTCPTQEEYDRILYCDITMQEGLVFKNVVENPQDYFINIQRTPIGRDWQFVETFDPGGSNTANDPDAYILWLFNTDTGTLQGLDEFKTSGLNLEQSCRKIWDIRRKWGWTQEKSYGFYCDNALARSTKQDNKKSLMNEYEIRLGVRITPCNDKGINKSILQVKQWLETGALKFSTNQEEMKNELFSYATHIVKKWDKSSGQIIDKEEYTDYNNHLIDAMRYGIIILEMQGFRKDQHFIDYVYNTEMGGHEEADVRDLTQQKISNKLGQTLADMFTPRKNIYKKL